MIVLDNAGTRALSLINTQNGANVEVNFSDYTTSTGVYARGVPTLTTISSGTTTSICATPASGVIRDIDYVNVYNTFAGSQNFTVQITSGSGGPFVLIFATLAQNESLNYTHGTGWCALDANGNRKEATSSVLASLTVTGNATIGGTLGVTGVATFTAQPIMSSLTASRPVFTDASKGLVSNTMTGTGDVVMSTSPTLSTSIVTGSSFTFAAAATTLNIGNSGGTNTILGATTFSQALTASSTITGSSNIFATGGSTPGVGTSGVNIWQTSNNVRVQQIDSSRSANGRVHTIDYTGGQVLFRWLNDAQSDISQNWLTATGSYTGSGTGVTGITSNSGSGSWSHTGAFAVTGTLSANSGGTDNVATLTGTGSPYLKIVGDTKNWIFQNLTGGAFRIQNQSDSINAMTIGTTGGWQAGAPTGGDKGLGTANFAADIYKNNTAYTNPDYVLEKWATGKIVKFADKDGAKGYAGLMPLREVESFARTNLHLPRFGQKADHGLFSGSDAILATVEESYLHLFDHEARIRKLEEMLK